MIVAGSYIGSQRASESSDPTCYTSPIQTVEYHWPQGHSAFVYALAAFAYLWLLSMVLMLWWQSRPCDTCGEFRHQCRCKARAY